jgi:hypothetical protein
LRLLFLGEPHRGPEAFAARCCAPRAGQPPLAGPRPFSRLHAAGSPYTRPATST